MINPNSQAGRLLAHLESGRSIDRLQSFTVLGIVELSARIVELQAAGYLINKVRKTVGNRFGEKISVTDYSLAEQEKAAA
jgi:hypothetical protein